MNTYHGQFSDSEKQKLDSLVNNWTFWKTTEYYARDNRYPAGRISATSVYDLLMKLTITKKAGKL
jgi:hypothetical protein